MDKIIKRLDELVVETAKNIGAKQASEGASLLLDYYRQSGDEIRTAQYICVLHFSVCQLFFENAISGLQNEQIESICSAIRNNDEYKKNRSNKGTARGYTAAAVLIANQNSFGKVFLMKIVADAEKGVPLSPAAVKLFRKHVVDYCKAKPLVELEESLWEDNLNRDKFRSILKAALSPEISPNRDESAETSDSGNVTQDSADTIRSDSGTRQCAQEECKDERVRNQNFSIPDKQAVDLAAQDYKLASFAHEVEVLLDTTQKANGALQILLRTIVNTNETPADLRRQITERDNQLSVLREQISERDRKVTWLERELETRNNSISQLQSANGDLTARLTRTLQLDASANNQELRTMRNDISKALKLEYQDYQDSKGKEQSADQFEAYKASLFRIFKTLKRYNINLD